MRELLAIFVEYLKSTRESQIPIFFLENHESLNAREMRKPTDLNSAIRLK